MADDADLIPGTETTVHITGHVISSRRGVLVLAVELADGTEERLIVDLTAAGVTTTTPGLTRNADHDRALGYASPLDGRTAEWLASEVRLIHHHLAQARRAQAEAEAQARERIRNAAGVLAGYIRHACNERTVPSRYRREGVLLAAAWIDPQDPTSPYATPQETP